MTLESINGAKSWLTAVAPESVAHKAGIRAGHTVEALDGVGLATGLDAARALGTSVRVRLRRFPSPLCPACSRPQLKI